MPFAFSVALAGGVHLLLGSLLLRRFHPRPLSALPFTSVYFAQMALWFAGYLILPLNAGLDRLVGHSLPLGVLIWTGVVVALAVVSRRGEGKPSPGRNQTGIDHQGWVLTLGGSAAILKVALVYSSSSHLGALGLDTHQHIYWTAQIIDANHLPLVERGTSILSLYPKAFHLLTAQWSAAGVVGPLGPWIKLMPFLQAFLPCMVFAELIRAREDRNGCEPGRSPLLAGLLIGALLFYSFVASRMIYPAYDLGGTPRFASGAALMLPYLLFVAGGVFESATLRRLSWAVLPATALLLLAINAVLVVQLAVFVVPLLLISRGFARKLNPAPRATRPSATTLALLFVITLVLPLAIAFGDPWIVAQWSTQLGGGFLDLVGVVTPDRAASLGLLSTDELVVEKSRPVLHAHFGELLRLFGTSLVDGARSWLNAGWRFPFYDDLFGDLGRIAVRLVIAVSVAAAMISMRASRLARGDGDKAGEDRTAAGLWLGIALGAGFGGFVQNTAIHVSEGLAVGRGYEFVLLHEYLEIATRHVGLVALGMILLASVGWANAAMPRLPAVEATFRKAWVTPVLAVAAAMLPFLLYDQSDSVDPAKSFWAPVSSGDLEDLRAIESHIGDLEGVLVPSNTWRIEGESWIIPQGPTAGILPFTTRRVLFNSRLGAGIQFNWRDLAAFCRGTDRNRAAFLISNDVRWFLLKGENSGSKSAFRRFRMCKLEFARLGVSHPPAHQYGELSLYRIDPQSLGRSTR